MFLRDRQIIFVLFMQIEINSLASKRRLLPFLFWKENNCLDKHVLVSDKLI